MELKAIIGKEPERIKGIVRLFKASLLKSESKHLIESKEAIRAGDEFYGMVDYDSSCKLISYLIDVGAESKAYLTNVNTVDSFKDTMKSPNSQGKNLYIHVSDLKDPIEFYSYLTQRGFILKDTKLTNKEKC